MKTQVYDKAKVYIFETRTEMGIVAAKDAAKCILECLEEKKEINCAFSAAPSQLDFLQALIADKTIPWERINAFHVDEYVGMPSSNKASFVHFLQESIMNHVPLNNKFFLNGENEPEAEMKRYTEALATHPLDIIFLGIGENGHIAFNDPDVADFDDKQVVKMVELDVPCRQQQVNDGCFLTLEDVPTHALTLTIPALLSAKNHFCIVPTELKSTAVKLALTGEIATTCPASILRTVEGMQIYLDQDAAKQL
ncbi:6-phosphogluconolactonase [Chakrabartyella piscis]|uniref:6-phosphogluconolactonase n=1 Tax=Chakrabartyella piscis TaxID=2918914 RepID=UPI002958C82B|nr:6-phosphogluconolactonase [Chakrabartyella piscis]